MKLQEISLKKSNNASYTEEQLINYIIDDLIIDENNLIYEKNKQYNILDLKNKEKKEVISSFIKTLFLHSAGENSEGEISGGENSGGEEIVFFDQKNRNRNFQNIKIKYES